MKKGLLLINLGTPSAPTTSAVRRYLRIFLSDPRVINLPAPLRYILLYGFILPLRPKQSAKAYQQIWHEKGSPLLINSKALKEKVQSELGDSWQVELGMRYGEPSIDKALNTMRYCEEITILPLYPQYSSAATGSSIEYALTKLQKMDVFPTLNIIRDFHNNERFIKAQANLIKPYLNSHDFILFSYHGVPENQLLTGPCKNLCQTSCSRQSDKYAGCYRAQCHLTTNAITHHLNLSSDSFQTTFQSRLGRTKWIEPYTENVLNSLYQQGVRKLAVTCPSFVADCLETLEEIGMRLKEQWLSIGGKNLSLIPSLNDDDLFVQAIASMAQKPNE